MTHTPTESTDRPLAENRVKHFRLGSRLGQGGYGEVYEAWDSQLHRKVAIKRLKTWSPQTQSGGLIDEARMAASLHHPAFVKIHSIEDDGHGHAIVMELVPGTTLRELLTGNPIDPARALGIVRQVADAMQAAHASNLVHGDLKPSNLMIEPSGKARILDLGLAFHDDPQATTSVANLEGQGTIAYMAPECLLGNVPSRQSDIFALGVVLYEMLIGRRPFAALSGLALAAAQMQSSSASWEFPAGMPANLADLIRALTARKPEERPASMAEVCRLVEAAATPGAPAIQPGAPAARSRPKWRPSRPGARAGLAAAIVLAVAAAGWGLAGSRLALPDALAPFSQSQAIARALQSLKQFDQPQRLDAAAADFGAILEHDADHAAAAAGMSLVYSFRYASNRQDETWLQRADASAQQALRLDPSLALAHVARAFVLGNQGDRVQALAEAERALALDPGNFFAALEKAICLTQLKRYHEAIAWTQQALRQHPGERVFADALGTVYFEQGDWDAAERAFKHSIAMQPDSVVAYANLNAVLLKQNRSDDALHVVQQGLQVRPTPALYGNLGNALFARGDYTGAVAAFEHAVTPPVGNPNKYLAWANLADTLLWIPGKTGQARAAYKKAVLLLEPLLQRTPGDATMLSRMGLYLARAGDASRSQALVARALAAAPADASVHFRAALAYELLGNRDQALGEVAQAKRFGYSVSAIDAEPDFVALRRDSRYQSQ